MYDTMKPEKRNFIIERLLRVEWDMFQRVGSADGKAQCQEDWHTFHIMRYSYYNAWSNSMILSYVRDLEEAMNAERNLITEKYAYMMEYTDPEYFNTKLQPYLPAIDEETRRLIDEIAAYLVDCDKEFAARYPKIGKKGRPIEAAKDNAAATSAETYTKGELRTYSKYTLRHFADYIRGCKESGTNFAFLVKDKMVIMYGYASLDDAEAKMGE
ncbi:MAG: hypothetical protein K0Q48_1955 [Bacillota bacterium]|jgi:hypothetical protein|nr:hypothetical protein [Bacillota bacterium]